MDHNPHLHDELVVPGDAHVEDADVYCGAQVIDVGHEAVGLPLERRITNILFFKTDTYKTHADSP